MSEFRTFPEFPLANFEKADDAIGKIYKQLLISHGLTAPSELRILYELAYGLHSKCDGYVLEFGTFTGVSASVMASALRDSQSKFKPLVCVDPYDFKPATLDVARDAFITLDLVPEYICQVLWQDLDYFNNFWKFPTRLIFADSDHSYGHVKSTLEFCVPRLLDDGWIVIHDYKNREKYVESVVRAANEWLDTTDFEVFVYHEVSSLYIKKLGLRRGVN